MENNRRKDDVTVQVIAERIDNLNNHISDLRDSMRDSMQKMTNAVEKLVRIEEGQMHMMQAHERLALQLDKQEDRCKALEARIDDLEKDAPMNALIRKWFLSAIWGIVGLVGMFAAKFMGLM